MKSPTHYALSATISPHLPRDIATYTIIHASTETQAAAAPFRHLRMHPGDRGPREEPTALHAPGAGLTAESGNTMAFIFFSLIVHRMNINYLS